MKQRTYSQNMKKQQGFTLLELLVVVSVLATLAGITAVAMDGYEQDAQEKLVQVEMQRIARAIDRFANDTGHYPKTGVLDEAGVDSDFSWLFSAPMYDSDGDDTVDKVMVWNPNAAIGWNGPYLTMDSQQRFLPANCDLNVAVDPDNLIVSLADTFEQRDKDQTTCFTVFEKGSWLKKTLSGTEYKYETNFTMNWHIQCTGAKNCVVLRSAGKDGVFSVTADPDSDDIVKVLRVNG